MSDIKAVSFTGHRPEKLGGYDKTKGINPKVYEYLKEVVQRLKGEGYKTFISGGALGVDQWAADAVLEDPELELVIALPFAKYGENWPKESQDYLAAQKAKPNVKVHVVCEGEYFENGKAQTWKNHARNKWMSDNSDVVVAIWNGDKEGGTASAVRYNKKQGKRMIRWNPKTLAEEPIE